MVWAVRRHLKELPPSALGLSEAVGRPALLDAVRDAAARDGAVPPDRLAVVAMRGQMV